MDYKIFLPDFRSLIGIDLTRPKLDFSTKYNIIILISVFAMFLSIFVAPWYEVTLNHRFTPPDTYSTHALETWYGISALVLSVIAILGCLYGKYSIVIFVALISIILAFIGTIDIPSVEHNGSEISPSEIKLQIKNCLKRKGHIEAESTGASLNAIASIVCVYATYKLLKTSK